VKEFFGQTDSAMSGLSDEQVKDRIEKFGYNEIEKEKKRSILNIVKEVLKEPMFLLLIACAGLYFFFGDLSDSLLLSFSACIVIGITVYQERKVERAIEALRDLSSPRALVMRNNEQIMIPGKEVVIDDILVLFEGDRVPADAVILSSSNLLVDESLLTGESVPVKKIEWDGKAKQTRVGGENTPFVYSSTLIVGGHATAKVISIGAQTEVGKIGTALKKIEPEQTVLQKETEKIVKIFSIAGFVVCALIIIFYSIAKNNFIEGLLAGLSAAMSMLPEEFAVVLTVFLALGAWRMSKSSVLTRRLNAIQNMGAATVLCTDKTGTLTLNKMTIQKLMLINGKEIDIQETKNGLKSEFHEILEFGILASQKNPFDPMEKAIIATGNNLLKDTHHLHNWELLKEYPLSKEILAVSNVWRTSDTKKIVIASKGALESIISLCHMSRKEKEVLLKQVKNLSGQGLRILGVAKTEFFLKHDQELPKDQHEYKFKFIGLIGLEDPLRESVPSSLKECHNAGIRVIMVTGDYAGTAMNVAKQAGFVNYQNVITGTELDKMSDEELKEKIKSTNIFARVVPEQKLRIIRALKSNHEVVMMTGDGVNDAPSLKAADIGIAMGSRGTEVARESAALVLLDDNFSSIEQAIRLGRRIYDNIKKAMSYIIAIHIPIAGLALIPVLFNWPLILFPAHIAFLELIIDPICSIAFENEAEEDNIMKRKPRKKNDSLFDKETIIKCIFQGLVVLVIVIGLYIYASNNPLHGSSTPSAEDARTLAFTALVISNAFIILSLRSPTKTIIETLTQKNNSLWIVLVMALTILGLTIYVPTLNEMFNFAPLHPLDIALCISAGLLSIALFEGAKVYNTLLKKTKDKQTN